MCMCFHLVKQQHRPLLLLVGSCLFYYSISRQYIIVLLGVILIDFFAAKSIQRHIGNKRKMFLILSLIANLGVLFFFKYYDFFSVVASNIGIANNTKLLNLVLPIGLSFHTFQAMAYTIDVYKGKQVSENDFINYALYVMFFPQLIAGPIERPKKLLTQLKSFYFFDKLYFIKGLRLILWGFFKKVVVADRLGILVDHIYEQPSHYDSVWVCLGVMFFVFQIYYDFSGYSDIAIGTARLFGINLTNNFNNPLQSGSISEFWKKWHITLGTWFKDYLYIPLGGNKVVLVKWVFITLLVFLLSGFWHGANFTFIVWGVFNGFIIVFERFFRGIDKRFVGLRKGFFFKILTSVYVFSVVALGFVFFRAKDLGQSVLVLRKMSNLFKEVSFSGKYYLNTPYLGLSKKDILFSVFSIVFIELVQTNCNSTVFNHFKRIAILRYAVYYYLVFSILFLGMHDQRNFLYFQF
jgi:alginate O-acetyltransferase complex protein AlgI